MTIFTNQSFAKEDIIYWIDPSNYCGNHYRANTSVKYFGTEENIQIFAQLNM